MPAHALAVPDRPRTRCLADLCVRHQAALYRTCLGVLRRSDLAEDAVQQTFLTVLRRGESQLEEGSESGWLHRVAVNASLQLLRAERRRCRHERATATGRGTPTERRGEESDPAEVRRAIDALPARWRLPVLLRYQEEMSYREIAAALDCPEGTVGYRLHEALQRLRESLARPGAAFSAVALEILLGRLPAVTLSARAAARLHAVIAGTAPVRAAGTAVVVTAAGAGAAKLLLAGKVAVTCAAAVGLAAAAWLGFAPERPGPTRTAAQARPPATVRGSEPVAPGTSAPLASEPVESAFPAADAAPRAEAAPRPAYPWVLSWPVLATHSALAKNLDLDAQDLSLTEILALLAKQTGRTFRAGDGVDADTVRITMKVQDLTLEQTLGLVGRMHDLRHVVAEDGAVVFVPVSEAQSPSEAWQALGLLERARSSDGDESLADRWSQADTEARDRLRSVLVREAIVEELPNAAIERLTRDLVPTITIPVDFDTLLKQPELPEVRVPAGLTLLEALEAIAGQSGLELVFTWGAARLDTPERAQQEREERRLKLETIDGILGREVAFPEGEVAGHGLAGQIRERAGVPVIVSEEVWNRLQPLPVPVQARPLREALEYLHLHTGLQWRLVEGTVVVY